MIPKTTKAIVSKILINTFRLVAIKLNHDQRNGIRELSTLVLKYRLLAVAMLVTNLSVAVFEGGTVGLLIVATNLLVGDESISFVSKYGSIGSMADKLIASWSRGGLFILLVVVAILAQIIKSGLLFLSKLASIRLSVRISRDLQKKITAQIISLSYEEISKRSAGNLIVMFQIADSAARVFLTSLNNIVLATIMFITYSAVLIIMSIPLTLTALLVILLLFLSLSRTVRSLKELGSRTTAGMLNVGKITYEYLNAPRLLRLFANSANAKREIDSARESLLLTSQKAETIKSTIDPIVDSIMIAGLGLFLVAGFIVAGDSSKTAIPELLVFIFVLNRLMPQVKVINRSIISGVNHLKHAETFGEFLRKGNKSYVRSGGKPFDGLKDKVEFREVDFSYGRNENDVSSLDFEIERGKTVALVGSSGAGKSTVADLLLGLYEPSKGTILVDGEHLGEINQSDWLRHIGVVDQDVFLLNTSIKNNIIFGRLVHDDDVKRAAKVANAHGFIRNLEEGYETVIGDRGYRLSGGQQQRIALARALYLDPEILVLDEATSSLDVESERAIQKTLAELHNKKTILVISHRFSTIVHADEIIVLDKGQIIERGSYKGLIELKGRFSQIKELQ